MCRVVILATEAAVVTHRANLSIAYSIMDRKRGVVKAQCPGDWLAGSVLIWDIVGEMHRHFEAATPAADCSLVAAGELSLDICEHLETDGMQPAEAGQDADYATPGPVVGAVVRAARSQRKYCNIPGFERMPVPAQESHCLPTPPPVAQRGPQHYCVVTIEIGDVPTALQVDGDPVKPKSISDLSTDAAR